jgi:hypothetical protein
VKRLVCFFACLTLIVFPFVAEAGIVNGGFETGDFTGWTPGGNNGVVSLANLQLDLSNSSAGSLEITPFKDTFMGALTYPALEGFVYDNFIYQDVPIGAPNLRLNLQYFFWTYDEAPFDTPGFTVSINGMTVFDKSAGDIGDGVLGTLDYTGWTPLSIAVGQYYDPSRPATIRIAFNAGNTGDNQFASGVFLDEIQLVPIPGTLLLLGSGLLGLVGLRRRVLRE